MDRRAATIDLAALPFDAEVMLDGLRPWVECESPTHDIAAVNAMMDLVQRQLFLMGAEVIRIPGLPGASDAVMGRFSHADQGQPGILILGHVDTVHPKGALPWRRDGDRCYGAGILDMKGGNFIALEAIRQLRAANHSSALPINVLFTGDEEVGSPATRGLIESVAARHKYVLVPEPARRDGGLVVGRFAIARHRVTTLGQSSHAGLRLSEGVSAIREMAHQIIAIESLTDADMTFSVGIVKGGQWSNVVSTHCEAEVLVAATTDAHLARSTQAMQGLLPHGATGVEVIAGPLRPVWTTKPSDRALYDVAAEIAGELGFEVPAQLSGGGSDGNFTGAMGVATLDGLGPRGDGPHTSQEHIIIDSLPERACLIAGLLDRLA
jgi:glutamate carboxypeptidase